MSSKRPKPLFAENARKNCPVCGQVSYSHTGIHPQCAAKLSDEKRKEEIKQKKLAEENDNKSKPKPAPRWQVKCPKCGATQHVRKKMCDCGYKLVADSPPTDSD